MEIFNLPVLSSSQNPLPPEHAKVPEHPENSAGMMNDPFPGATVTLRLLSKSPRFGVLILWKRMAARP